mmetsp:Transcript_42058/g.116144  ORF Transcript_42058/g.116144 Transcript_42058/m.116144 type:complete len:214 (-) Transcript_42058:216-857(-)
MALFALGAVRVVWVRVVGVALPLLRKILLSRRLQRFAHRVSTTAFGALAILVADPEFAKAFSNDGVCILGLGSLRVAVAVARVCGSAAASRLSPWRRKEYALGRGVTPALEDTVDAHIEDAAARPRDTLELGNVAKANILTDSPDLGAIHFERKDYFETLRLGLASAGVLGIRSSGSTAGAARGHSGLRVVELLDVEEHEPIAIGALAEHLGL